MSIQQKGSEFEREICKLLSLWWTKNERDDVFWRSSQSGGRATRRKNKGRRTYGSYGDIAAVDPIGEPFLKAVTIELKRGRSHGCPSEVIDASPTNCARDFEETLLQTFRSHVDAQSLGWMLVCRRDYHQTVVYLDLRVVRMLLKKGVVISQAPSVKFNVLVTEGARFRRMAFLCLPFQLFLDRTPPSAFR